MPVALSAAPAGSDAASVRADMVERFRVKRTVRRRLNADRFATRRSRGGGGAPAQLDSDPSCGSRRCGCLRAVAARASMTCRRELERRGADPEWRTPSRGRRPASAPGTSPAYRKPSLKSSHDTRSASTRRRPRMCAPRACTARCSRTRAVPDATPLRPRAHRERGPGRAGRCGDGTLRTSPLRRHHDGGRRAQSEREPRHGPRDHRRPPEVSPRAIARSPRRVGSSLPSLRPAVFRPGAVRR